MQAGQHTAGVCEWVRVVGVGFGRACIHVCVCVGFVTAYYGATYAHCRPGCYVRTVASQLALVPPILGLSCFFRYSLTGCCSTFSSGGRHTQHLGIHFAAIIML